jgi:hypothetical protein
MRRLQRRLDPHTREKREPLEILARLAGRTTFVLRGDPTGAAPITPLDVAQALAASDDKLGVEVAMAIACQRPNNWPIVHQLGLPRLLAHLEAQRKMPGIVDGHRRFRARLALREAFDRLVAPAAQHATIRETALAWHCDARACRFLIRAATAILEDAANTAASDACAFLFALYIAAAPVDESEPTSARAVFASRRRPPVGLRTRDEFIAWLLAELDGARERRPGVLTRECGPHSPECVDSNREID